MRAPISELLEQDEPRTVSVLTSSIRPAAQRGVHSTVATVSLAQDNSCMPNAPGKLDRSVLSRDCLISRIIL